MPPKKAAGQVVQAEVALQQSLKNCLVNLPASLVSVLVNANTVSDACHALQVLAESSLLDFAKCHRRTLVPATSSARRRRIEELLAAKVCVLRMDGHAKQAQACACGGTGGTERK